LRADVRQRTRRRAVAAVPRIGRGGDAAARAIRQAGAARSGASARRAHLPRGTRRAASTAVVHVTLEIATGSAAHRLSRRARELAVPEGARIAWRAHGAAGAAVGVVGLRVHA